jgi:hypothetical protein
MTGTDQPDRVAYRQAAEYLASAVTIALVITVVVHAQLAGAERPIGDVTGHSPRPLFRFPFGDRDQRTIAAGYIAVRLCAHCAVSHPSEHGLPHHGLRVECRWTVRPDPARLGRVRLSAHPPAELTEAPPLSSRGGVARSAGGGGSRW